MPITNFPKNGQKVTPAENWDQSLNTEHISNNLTGYEAARSSFFIFQVSPDQLANLLPPDIAPTGDDKDNYYDSKTVSDYLRLNVVKASIPSFTVEAVPYRRGNDVVKYAGVPTFNDGSITVDDIVGLHIKDMLYAWLYLAYNPNTRMGGRMAEYKKKATLMEYTQDYQLIRTWTLEGCFITGIEESEFDRENDDKRQISVNISYDRATMKPEHESF